nr:unnamed protein product [Callosobruchus analis]
MEFVVDEQNIKMEQVEVQFYNTILLKGLVVDEPSAPVIPPADQIFQLEPVGTPPTAEQQNIIKIEQIEEQFSDSNELSVSAMVPSQQIFELQSITTPPARGQQSITKMEHIKEQFSDTSTSRPKLYRCSFVKEPYHCTCAVKGCKCYVSVGHKFPNPRKFNRLFQKWINSTGNEALAGLEPITVYNNCRVCHRHFAEDDTHTNNRLKKGVVPSLNLPVPLIRKVHWYVLMLHLLLLLQILVNYKK